MAIAGRDIFAGTAGPVTANYSGFDIARGTGIQTFFGGLTNFASAAYILRQEAFDSDNVLTASIHTDVTLGQNSYGIVNSGAFDVQFLRPQIMEGTALLNIPHGALNGTDGKTNDSHIRATIRTVRDGVETDVGFASGSSHIMTGSNTEYRTSAIRIPIPRTHIKVNDILRLHVEQFAKVRNTSTTITFFIAHDPKSKDASTDRDSVGMTQSFNLTSGATILKLDIPFIVDV